MLQSPIWNPLQGKPRYQYRPRLNPAHPLNQGLVAWWLFNERGGSNLGNIANSSYSGAIVGASWGSSEDGHLDITGLSTYVSIGNKPFLGAGSSYTIIARIYDRGGHSLSGTIICNRSAWSSNNEFNFGIIGGNPGYLSVSKANNYSNWQSIPINTWLTLGVVVTPARAQAYINGTPGEYVSEDRTTGAITTNSISIGKLVAENSEYFDGKIASIQVWKLPLNDALVKLASTFPYGTPSNPRLIVEPRYAPWVSVGTTPPVETNLSQMMMMGMG